MGRRRVVTLPAAMKFEPGQIIEGKYRIVRLLGQGAMGAVYEGENIRIRRRIAIKVLHVGQSTKSDTIQRFEREAQAAGRIGSEHIVEVLDFGELPEGTRFMIMEYLEGMTLAQRIRSKGRLPPNEANIIIQQLLEGLGAAHRAGIIHRDLKPANVFLATPKGQELEFVKILDFGVSKFNLLSDEMSMTKTGTVLGTPYYMSPEQAKGAKIDARSDLYTVGVILYETITGQVPFSAETFNELIFRIVLESPPPAESFVPDLDPAFAALVRKAMSREPADRFQTAQAFTEALEAWESRLPQELSLSMLETQIRSPAIEALESSTGASRLSTNAASRPTDSPQPAQPQRGKSGTIMMDHVTDPLENQPQIAIPLPLPPTAYDASQSAQSVSVQQPPMSGPVDSIVIPKHRSGMAIAVVVGALILIGGSTWAALHWFKSRSPDDPSAKSLDTTQISPSSTEPTSTAPANATQQPSSTAEAQEPTLDEPPGPSATVTAPRPAISLTKSATPLAQPTEKPVATTTTTPLGSSQPGKRTVSSEL